MLMFLLCRRLVAVVCILGLLLIMRTCCCELVSVEVVIVADDVLFGAAVVIASVCGILIENMSLMLICECRLRWRLSSLVSCLATVSLRLRFRVRLWLSCWNLLKIICRRLVLRLGLALRILTWIRLLTWCVLSSMLFRVAQCSVPDRKPRMTWWSSMGLSLIVSWYGI